MKRIFQTSDDWSLAILRVIAGCVFFAHGAQKVLGWFGGYGFSATMNTFTHHMGIPTVFAFLAICAEFLGGLGLIAGFLSRIAALGIAIEMIVAVMKFHRHVGFFMNWNGTQRGEGFEYHLLALGIMLVILVKGSGSLSVDRALSS